MEAFFGGNTVTFTYAINGDTLINQINYKVLYRSDEEYPVNWTKHGYIREDEDHKVYYIPYHSAIANLDDPKMVYNFSADIGDTLLITSFAYNYPNELEVIISDIDTVLVNDNYRKRIFYQCEYFPDNFWIEGIGSNNGLIEPGFYCYIICPIIELLCVKEGETVIYKNQYAAECYVVGENEKPASEDLFVLYPNPTKSKLFVIPPQHFYENLTFILSNLQNVTVLEKKIINFNISEINIDGFKPGIYLYLIINRQGLVQNGKIIVTN
jgi:hypothetical protein